MVNVARAKRKRLKKAPRFIPPPWRHYANQLMAAMDYLAGLVRVAVERKLPDWLARGRDLVDTPESRRADAVGVPEEIAAIISGIRIVFQQRVLPVVEKNSRQAGQTVQSRGRTIANAQFKALLGIEPLGSEPWLDPILTAYVQNNVSLIKTVGETYLGQVEQIVRDGALSNRKQKDIQDEIMERTGVSRRRAKTIARDQTGKLHSQLTSVRMQRNGIKRYQWSTSNDERVRLSHRAKDGNIYSFDDPPSDTGNPGEDYNCRCVAIPVLDEE